MKPQLEIIDVCQRRSLQYKIDRGFWSVWHYHPEIDIFLFIKHTGNVLVGDTLVPFKPGTMLLLGSDLPHAVQPSEEGAKDDHNDCLHVIQFSTKSLGEEFMKKPEMNHIKLFLEQAKRGLEFHGKTLKKASALIEEMQKLNDVQKLGQLLKLLDILAGSEDATHLASPHYSVKQKANVANDIEKVFEYIHENYKQPISLQDISERMFMTPKSFSRFFSKKTGTTFVRYLNTFKVGIASEMLLQSDDNITHICFESGFNNISNFNRQFLAIKGMTPHDYREKYRASVTSAKESIKNK